MNVAEETLEAVNEIWEKYWKEQADLNPTDENIKKR